MDRALPSRAGRIISTALLLASLGFLVAAGYLYYIWLSVPSAHVPLVQPYESLLLYTQHYDWANAPFLQALQGASVCALFWAITRLLSRMVDRWRVWLPWLVFSFTVQIAIFNVVVNDMTAQNWLYNVYLVMSWLEPWLVVTLASVADGLYSTGGVALVALLVSSIALFAARRPRGLFVALSDVSLFLSTFLLIFELGILEYRSMWWNLWITQFQVSVGLQWLTNHLLYSAMTLCVPLFICLRLGVWWFGRWGRTRFLSHKRLP